LQNYKELSEYHRTDVTLKEDNCCYHCDLWITKRFESRVSGSRIHRHGTSPCAVYWLPDWFRVSHRFSFGQFWFLILCPASAGDGDNARAKRGQAFARLSRCRLYLEHLSANDDCGRFKVGTLKRQGSKVAGYFPW